MRVIAVTGALLAATMISFGAKPVAGDQVEPALRRVFETHRQAVGSRFRLGGHLPHHRAVQFNGATGGLIHEREPDLGVHVDETWRRQIHAFDRHITCAAHEHTGIAVKRSGDS